MCREPVPHTERLCSNRLGNQTGRFHLSQLLTQDLGGHPRHRAAELTESKRANVAEPPADHRFPPAFDDLDCRVHRASLAFGVTWASRHSWEGYLKVPDCEHDRRCLCFEPEDLWLNHDCFE